MLERIVESFLSKVGEKLVDYAEHSVWGIKDYKSTLEALSLNLRSLSARAYDVEDEIKNAELTGKKKRKREVDYWLEEVRKLEADICTLESEVQSEGFVGRFLGGDRATKLKTRVLELVEVSKSFNTLVLDAHETRGELLPTTRLVGETFVENLERIWTSLRADNVSRIGIFGMGGVGKTTLAKHINNKIVDANQGCVIWVTVSQESSTRMLQDKIAHVLRIDLSDEYDEEKRAASLNRALSLRKNLVLILDDVWKYINLEKVGYSLCDEGCKLFITTRSLQVCRQMRCQQLIPVKTLDTNEAWNLFRETLGPETTRSHQVEQIAKSVARACDGLPLGIITLAGSMRGETSIHAWRNALTELRKSVMEHDDMEDQVFKVLKYSFDRLNSKHQEQGKSNSGYTKLQLCFLYCSLYPEDFIITRHELVGKFILEELVDKMQSRRAQVDKGHTILDQLVNACLLESAKNSYGRDSVKMHDLVRAMARKIADEKYTVLARCRLKQIPNEEEYWTQDVEKMSLMLNDIKEIPDGISPNCPKLSTLLLQENFHLMFIADSFFSQMHGLCVLDLSYTSISKLPNSLSELENLKALLLHYCTNLIYLPCLGKLTALKELNLSVCTSIEQVPRGMDKLLNLECLRLPYQLLVPLEELGMMGRLEEFQGRVKDVTDFNLFMSSRPHIKYCIKVGTFQSYWDDMGPWYRNEVNNDVFMSRCNLREHVPILAQDIRHLQLQECEGLGTCLLDDFTLHDNLKSLKTLKLYASEGIECILAENEELESHFLPLRDLEGIRLARLPDFMGIRVALPKLEQAVFSCLTKLFIHGCSKMKRLGLTRLECTNLETMDIRSCEGIEEIIEQGEEQEVDAVTFPKLRWLTLVGLPRLKSICRATMICDSIKFIHLIGCPELKKLPLFFPVDDRESSGHSYTLPPSLRGIILRRGEEEWWESLEWDHPSHEHLLLGKASWNTFTEC